MQPYTRVIEGSDNRLFAIFHALENSFYVFDTTDGLLANTTAIKEFSAAKGLMLSLMGYPKELHETIELEVDAVEGSEFPRILTVRPPIPPRDKNFRSLMITTGYTIAALVHGDLPRS
jgi:hypothetical protein